MHQLLRGLLLIVPAFVVHIRYCGLRRQREFFDLWVVDCKEHVLEEDDELANDVRSYYEWWLYIVGNLDVGLVGNLVICLICLLTLLNLLAEGFNLRSCASIVDLTGRSR